MYRLGILGSTRGTNLLALISAIKQKILNASIEIVISNKQDALILQRARAHQLNTEFIDPKNVSREDYDKKISATLHQHQVNLVILIGYMKILSPTFVNEWRDKIINIHPSLLPDFAGGMDQTVHQAVLNSGRDITGCTVHLVIEEVDKGRILIQKKCSVLPNDTVDNLKTRVQQLEGEALVEVIRFGVMNRHPY